MSLLSRGGGFGGGGLNGNQGGVTFFNQASVKVILCVVGLHKLDKIHEKSKHRVNSVNKHT